MKTPKDPRSATDRELQDTFGVTDEGLRKLAEAASRAGRRPPMLTGRAGGADRAAREAAALAAERQAQENATTTEGVAPLEEDGT